MGERAIGGRGMSLRCSTLHHDDRALNKVKEYSEEYHTYKCFVKACAKVPDNDNGMLRPRNHNWHFPARSQHAVSPIRLRGTRDITNLQNHVVKDERERERGNALPIFFIV